MSNGIVDTPVIEQDEPIDHAMIVAAWEAANSVVQAHYTEGGIDGFPVFSEQGQLEKFLFTRRLACVVHNSDLPDQFGAIELAGETGPRLIKGADVGGLDGIETFVSNLDEFDEALAGHERCWHRYAAQYPRIYQAVTNLVSRFPQVVVAREIYVDKEFVDGTYHPLYLHSFVQEPMMVYDWFAIEADEQAVFLRITGEASIFRSEKGTWRFVGAVLKERSTEEIEQQLIEWLHLG